MFSRSQASGRFKGTRILLCAWDPAFERQLIEDAGAYQQHYCKVKVEIFGTAQALIEQASKSDIVHISCILDPAGSTVTSAGEKVSASGFVAACESAGVKVLILANTNPADCYIKGVSAKGKRINLIMTLDRKETLFPKWLERLAGLLARGLTISSAWVILAPQAPGEWHEQLPSTILWAGLPDAILLP